MILRYEKMSLGTTIWLKVSVQYICSYTVCFDSMADQMSRKSCTEMVYAKQEVQQPLLTSFCSFSYFHFRNLCNVWEESFGHQELQADICVMQCHLEKISAILVIFSVFYHHVLVYRA